jgi:hypothetical protein
LVQCVYKDWGKVQWLPTEACAILKQLTKQPMKGDSKRYVDQVTQNVIALLHICHLKNSNQDQSYRSVRKIKKLRCVVESRPVVSDRRKTKNSHGFNIGSFFGVSILEDKGHARNELWDVVYQNIKCQLV